MEKKNQYKWMGLFALGFSILINTPLTIAIILAFILMVFSVRIGDDNAEEIMNMTISISEDEMNEQCEFVGMIIATFTMLVVIAYKIIILI